MKTLTFEEISQKIKDYKQEGKGVFVSSSFQTHSIPLIHIISRVDNSIPIYFIDTGFHFSETLYFKDKIAELLNIKVISLKSHIPKNLQLTTNDNKFIFSYDPDYCCQINKIIPMQTALRQYDVWISGIRGEQNDTRKSIGIEEKTDNVIRFHPMIGWSAKMIYEYRKEYNLPEHPLDAQGYLSIGCEPCTGKVDLENMSERDGRWQGLKKTECGLHLIK